MVGDARISSQRNALATPRGHAGRRWRLCRRRARWGGHSASLDTADVASHPERHGSSRIGDPPECRWSRSPGPSDGAFRFYASDQATRLSSAFGDSFSGEIDTRPPRYGEGALRATFDDSEVTDWRYVGQLGFPDLAIGIQGVLVMCWRSGVDASPLSEEERERVRESHEATFERLLGYHPSSIEGVFGRIVTPSLLVRLLLEPKPSKDSVGVGSVYRSHLSFVSGSPYRAFRFGVPEAWRESASSSATVTLELYWPEGEPIGNLPERVALAFRAAEDLDRAETSGGLQLATSTVVRYKQSGDNPRENMNYQALRPVWR